MLAYRCANYSAFVDGRCALCQGDGQACAPVGLYADTGYEQGSEPGKFYVQTNPRAPFCRESPPRAP